MNCTLCEDRGYTESAWCGLTYHTHGWISRYDKSRGACTEPCICGFDPEDEVEEDTPVVTYGGEKLNGVRWTPTQFELNEPDAGSGEMLSRATRSLRKRFAGLQQQGWAHNPVSRPRGWVTTDKSVVGLCEEAARTCVVPPYLAGEPIEVKQGAEGLSLLVRYTFMESSMHVLFTGYAADCFRFAHLYDESYTTREVMG